MKKVIIWLDIHLEEFLSAITLLALTCAMTLQIIMRFVFHHALPWPEEFCRYCFIYSAMLGLGYCVRHNCMLQVDLLVNFFPKKFVQLLQICVLILTLFFFAILIRPAWNTTMESFISNQTSSATGIPIWITYLAGPIGFLCASLRTIQALIQNIRQLLHTKKGVSR